ARRGRGVAGNRTGPSGIVAEERLRSPAMSDITRLRTNQRMSQAVIHGDTVYLAGQVSDADGVGAQTRGILASIDGLLAECCTDKSKILMATIWLSDIGTFDEMNAEWDAWVPDGHAPARACVESKLAGPQFLVEIRVVAAR